MCKKSHQNSQAFIKKNRIYVSSNKVMFSHARWKMALNAFFCWGEGGVVGVGEASSSRASPAGCLCVPLSIQYYALINAGQVLILECLFYIDKMSFVQIAQIW
jgi:hypothetical protein